MSAADKVNCKRKLFEVRAESLHNVSPYEFREGIVGVNRQSVVLLPLKLTGGSKGHYESYKAFIRSKEPLSDALHVSICLNLQKARISSVRSARRNIKELLMKIFSASNLIIYEIPIKTHNLYYECFVGFHRGVIKASSAREKISQEIKGRFEKEISRTQIKQDQAKQNKAYIISVGKDCINRSKNRDELKELLASYNVEILPSSRRDELRYKHTITGNWFSSSTLGEEFTQSGLQRAFSS